jgi:hypothetical protein
MVAEQRSLVVETVATYLLAGLLTVGVMCSSAQEREARRRLGLPEEKADG